MSSVQKVPAALQDCENNLCVCVRVHAHACAAYMSIDLRTVCDPSGNFATSSACRAETALRQQGQHTAVSYNTLCRRLPGAWWVDSHQPRIGGIMCSMRLFYAHAHLRAHMSIEGQCACLHRHI